MLKQPTQIQGSVYLTPTLSIFEFSPRVQFLAASTAGASNESLSSDGEHYDGEWI